MSMKWVGGINHMLSYAVTASSRNLYEIGDPYGHPIHEVTSLRIFGSRKSWAQRWNGLDE
jgi:hypothetical protein